MRRVPLEELCLQIKAMGFTDAQAFLSRAMDPPTPRAVEAALQTLMDVQVCVCVCVCPYMSVRVCVLLFVAVVVCVCIRYVYILC